MKLARISLHAAFGLLMLIGFGNATVTAADSKTAQVVQPTGYASDGTLQEGTIVQVSDKTAHKVTPATSKQMSAMFGVVVNRGDLTFTIGSDTLPNEVYVATTGTYNVLVSNQNGPVKAGDYLTLSAVDGVAMKADTRDKDPYVIGQASGNFDGKTNVIGQVPLKNTDGSTADTASLTLLPVAINIKANPLVITTKSNLPQWLTKVGQEIARKQVSQIRIILSLIITGLSILISLTVLYSGVRNAIISIGRNPLSKKSIYRGLAEVILTGFLILIIGMFAVYLLLKL